VEQVVAEAVGWIRHKLKSKVSSAALLLAPASLFLLVLFVVPLAKLVVESFAEPDVYLRLWNEPLYVQVLISTIELALAVTACCLVFGYLYAIAMTHVGPRMLNVMLVVVLLPYWTSVLVRSYAWLAILQKGGIINQILLGTGLLREPAQLVYNFSGVVCGMSYIMLPYMVMVLYTSIRRIDEQLVLVGRTMGSTRGEAFRRIVLPLSLPGIMTGSVLVFILSLGFFITPALLGGRRQVTFSMLIDIQMNQLLDWRFGAALSIFLLIITFLVLVGLNRISRVRVPVGWIR
jgi:ABC-type spermidine/putrescine transport system permease subunit I